MAWWNTNWSNVTGVYELVKVNNDVTQEMLVGGIVFAIFFVMLLTLKKYDFDDALIASSWSAFILCLFASFAQLLSLYWPLVFGIIVAIGMALKFIWKS